jgi:hypothetical protein
VPYPAKKQGYACLVAYLRKKKAKKKEKEEKVGRRRKPSPQSAQ